MWFFMITCYIFSALSLVMLLTAFVQNIYHFNIFSAGELTFIILTSIIYLFTETLIMFFFVGTGVSIKEYTQEHNKDHRFHKNSIAIKRKVYPPQLLNILLMMILFIMLGAVHTGKVPVLVYRIYFLLCLAHFFKAKWIQNESFKENTANILDMVGLERKF